MTTIGDNSNGRLKSFVERVERLEEEKANLQANIKDVYSEIKSSGYDVKAVRVIIKERKADAQELAELEAIIEMYKADINAAT